MHTHANIDNYIDLTGTNLFKDENIHYLLKVCFLYE